MWAFLAASPMLPADRHLEPRAGRRPALPRHGAQRPLAVEVFAREHGRNADNSGRRKSRRILVPEGDSSPHTLNGNWILNRRTPTTHAAPSEVSPGGESPSPFSHSATFGAVWRGFTDRRRTGEIWSGSELPDRKCTVAGPGGISREAPTHLATSRMGLTDPGGYVSRNPPAQYLDFGRTLVRTLSGLTAVVRQPPSMVRRIPSPPPVCRTGCGRTPAPCQAAA